MNKKILFLIVLIPVAGFAYYAISPLFIHIKADDTLPGLSTGVVSTSSPSKERPAIPTSIVADERQGTIVGSSGHPASGTARIVNADGKAYLRYENFKTINGPDIYVYLAKDLDAKDYINLGKVKATEGNINYEIPAGTVVTDYPYVLTWCKTFGVLFNYAKLN